MAHPDSSTTGGSDHDGVDLRLLLPQWQGAGTSSVEAFASEFPLDVDAVDSNEIVLGLGVEPDGLKSTVVRRIVADAAGAVDIVGFTIAEFIPRQVMHLRQIVDGFPLIPGTTAN